MTPLLLPQADAESRPESVEDRRLRSDIDRALLATGNRCLRHVCVSVRGRVITTRGLVPSYYLKQLTQVAVRSAAGPYELRDEVTVSPG